MPNHIVELDAHLQNQIAAGEVVERPASIVKELVENAIDAQCSTVKLYLKKDSLSFEISDNGHGISFDEVPIALKRHTTSKIYNAADLQTIRTLGFRGEALASIASVCDLTITSRHTDSNKARSIGISAGKQTHDKTTSHPVGTTIAISSIFDTVPARKKFLKTIATEIKYIKEEFLLLVLAWPQIGFTLYEEDSGAASGKAPRETLNVPPEQSAYDRIVSVHKDFDQQLLPIETEGLDFSIHGFVTKPSKMYKRATYCHFFINQRPIQSPMLLKAVREAYYTVIPDNSYPGAFVYITLDPLLVDVNVHPRKKEVKFTNPSDLYRIMYESVKHTLESQDLTQTAAFPSSGTPGQKYADPWKGSGAVDGLRLFDASLRGPSQGTFSGASGRAFGDAFGSAATGAFGGTSYDKKNAYMLPRQHRESTLETTTGVRYIAQLQQSYLLYEDQEGLVVVDQHALHERINYDRLKANLAAKKPEKQQLFIPLHFDIPLTYTSLFEKIISILTDIGFEIEELSGNSFQMRAIPKMFQNINFEKLWPDLLEELLEETSGMKAPSLERIVDETLHSIACRSSIMFHDTMYPEEAIRLWERSEQIPIETSCPHGRPTKFRITFSDLNKYFLR